MVVIKQLGHGVVAICIAARVSASALYLLTKVWYSFYLLLSHCVFELSLFGVAGRLVMLYIPGNLF